MNERLVSDRSPYVPLDVFLPGKSGSFESLLDTGFEGDVVIPESFAADADPSDEYRRYRLADGSRTWGAVYFGTIRLGALGTFPARIVALGDECLIGLRVANRFKITLDHGRELVVEP